MQRNPGAVNNLAAFYFSKLDGEQGILSDNRITDLHYLLMNCCFFFCEFLIDGGVDAELVNNSTDYFVNRIQHVETEKQMQDLVNDIAEASLWLYKKRDDKPYGAVIRRSINYISQQLYSNVNLESVAAYIGVTPQYLTSRFKRETGKTLYCYIEDKKNDEAKIMLAHTSKPVTIIANALGFSSTAHFSAAFKKRVGCTPSEYRSKRVPDKSRFRL
ncbi:MAG: AraC family transcriptional regulator [Spirochaetales bacterium]|nr:AraC family transcriptional regulator [Spirochaetales bacterium]